MKDHVLFAGYTPDKAAVIFRDKDDNFTEIGKEKISNLSELRLFRYYKQNESGAEIRFSPWS